MFSTIPNAKILVFFFFFFLLNEVEVALQLVLNKVTAPFPAPTAAHSDLLPPLTSPQLKNPPVHDPPIPFVK